MPRRTQPARVVSEIVDATIPNTPDALADNGTLREHYKQVLVYFATHTFDDVTSRCKWCLKDEQAYTRKSQYGDKLFCSERCRDASAVHHGYVAPVEARGPDATVPSDAVEGVYRGSTVADSDLDDTARVLMEVPEDGTGIGNGKLLKRLKWSNDRYIEARDKLIVAGTLVSGRGRGGSVKRAS